MYLLTVLGVCIASQGRDEETSMKQRVSGRAYEGGAEHLIILLCDGQGRAEADLWRPTNGKSGCPYRELMVMIVED